MVIGFFIALAVAFILSALLGIVVLPGLRRLKASQTEREEGPASHKVKTGTPTMGGIIFIVAFVLVAGFFAIDNKNIIPIIIATLGFGLVGFIDDYIKVVMKRNLGLRAWQKMLCQFIVTGVLLWYMHNYTQVSFDMLVPFSAFFSANAEDLYINMGALTIPFLFVVIIGTVNGSNFTDGLDGLLSTVTAVICVFLAFISLNRGVQITPAAGAMLGALLGFLIYNWHPAKVFMGDTGSLALGGFVASAMLMLKMPILLIFVAFIYLAEVVSVIIQVLYFKATGGKRFFRMAPIHHHFELGGWSEVKVVRMFSLLTGILCFVAYMIVRR
ncbi:MAG: phospho-N-acetylmuramoyl-pentapeptide-transferase [Lachnospiraceae bacterium]|nr:phospho-N-acetylmuramoyl-pentapeptide-transferase [Lachnospiraceae bacterium]